MSSDPPAVYDYDQVVDRIEEVLGERPSKSALRAEAAQRRRTNTPLARPRLTLGLPPPLPATSRTSPAAFPAAAIEAWLRTHPRLTWVQAMNTAQQRLASGEVEEDVIAGCLAAGLSWRNITVALNAHDGRSRSTAGVHKRYRHLAP